MLDEDYAKLVPAVSGLIGVLLGAALTALKEWQSARTSRAKQLGYLGVRMVCLLDRFSAGCAEVVTDDGLADGQHNSEGCREYQVKDPEFSPDGLDVDWRVLKPAMAFAILDLPYNVEIARHKIASVFEYEAGPPDYEEGFEERKLQFSRLGIAADNLATGLRRSAKLPYRIYEDWSPVQVMMDSIAQIERKREARKQAMTGEEDEESAANA